MRNYFRLGFSEDGDYVHYIYFDIEGMVAGNLLDRRQITWYEADIMSKPDERLRLVSIKLKKEDEDRFQMAMEDLKKMMLFRGQQDYEQSCTEMIEGLKKMISLTAETTGWIELPEGGRIRAGAMA